MIRRKKRCRKTQGALIKVGKCPVSLKKGETYKSLCCRFSRKVGDLIWGTDGNHKYVKVKFDFYVLDPNDGVLKNSWYFDPDDVTIV